MKTKITVLFITFFASSLISFSQVATIANFPGTERSGAVGFAIGDYGYVGLGNKSADYFKDFWRYNPQNNTWAEIAEFPGEARSNAVSFVIGNYAFVGTGIKKEESFIYFSDFYKYSPESDEWTQIANFGGAERGYSVSFAINDFGYVGTGSTVSGQVKDFWKYNPSTNEWVQIADSPDEKAWASAFAINGKGYLVAGLKYNNGSPFVYSDVQEYNPTNDQWVERIFADGINLSFSNATAFVIDGIGYIAYGNKNFVASYNPANNDHENIGDFFELSSVRNHPTSFNINGIVYLGLGYWVENYTTTVYTNQFKSYTPPLPEPTSYDFTGGGSYCEGNSPTGVNAQLSGSQQRLTYQLYKDEVEFGDPLTGTGEVIEWTDLPAGEFKVIASNGESDLEMNGTVTVQEVPYSDAEIEIETESLETCEGQITTIYTDVTYGGDSPAFTWFVNDAEQDSNSDSFDFIAENNDIVSCQLTSNYACVNEPIVTSNELQFSVTENVNSTIEISTESLEVDAGESVLVTSEVTNQGESPIYKWFINDVQQDENSNSLTFIPSNGDVIYCELTSSITCLSENPVESNELVFTVNENTSAEEGLLGKVSISPNPFENVVQISNASDARRFVITNIIGEVVLDMNLNQSANQTITTNLPSGIYMVSIIATDGSRVVRKMIKK